MPQNKILLISYLKFRWLIILFVFATQVISNDLADLNFIWKTEEFPSYPR
jgi:hypothetical protein